MNKLTIEEVINIGKKFYKVNKIKYRFINRTVKTSNVIRGGCADLEKELVYIYYDKKDKTIVNWLASTVLHEYYHIYCRRNKIYPTYHNYPGYYDSKKIKSINNILSTGLRAERHVDKLASIKFKEMFPSMRFHKAYRNKKAVKWFNETHLKYYHDIKTSGWAK